MLTYALDNESNRLELARLYNEMCKVINENEQESFQTYTGNKSAGLRLRRNLRPLDSLCEEVVKILKVQLPPADFSVGLNQSSMQGEDHINGEDADVQSDSHEDDLGAGDEVNSDSKQHFANSKASPKKSSNSGVGTFSSTTATASTLSRGFQIGQEARCNTNSADLLTPYPKGGANIEVMEGREDRSGCLLMASRVIVLDD